MSINRNFSRYEIEKRVEEIDPIIRKLAHFGLYLLVGISACCLVCTFNTNWKYRVWISIFIGLVYAITDEIHQSFIPGRSGEIRDVIIDTLGVATGILMVLYIIKVINKRNNNI